MPAIVPSESPIRPRAASNPSSTPQVFPGLFKAYDIRGIVDTLLTAEAVRAIGLSLGTEGRRGVSPSA
jgi:hypothetical protein